MALSECISLHILLNCLCNLKIYVDRKANLSFFFQNFDIVSSSQFGGVRFGFVEWFAQSKKKTGWNHLAFTLLVGT